MKINSVNAALVRRHGRAIVRKALRDAFAETMQPRIDAMKEDRMVLAKMLGVTSRPNGHN